MIRDRGVASFSWNICAKMSKAAEMWVDVLPGWIGLQLLQFFFQLHLQLRQLVVLLHGKKEAHFSFIYLKLNKIYKRFGGKSSATKCRVID